MAWSRTPYLVISPSSLRGWRLRAALTQGKLGKDSGVSVARISNMERGKDLRVHVTTVSRLAEVLGCEPSDISDVVEEAS